MNMLTEESRIAAVHERRLRSAAQAWWLEQPDDEFAQAALRTCDAIDSELADEVERLAAEAKRLGVGVGFEASAKAVSQTMLIVARPADDAAMGPLAEMLADLDYHGWETAMGPARVFTSTGDSTFMIDVESAGGFRSQVWRLAEAAKTRLDRSGNDSIGPYLGTPTSLIPALVEFAGITDTDTMVDLGCGDARLAVEVARQTGATTIGVENDPALVARAKRKIHRSDVADRVKVELADATSYDLRGITVVMLFLPAPIAAAQVPGIRKKMDPGARLVAHEQAPIEHQLPPTESKVLLARNAITVGHLWSS